MAYRPAPESQPTASAVRRAVSAYAAAWLQPARLSAEPIEFVVYWVAVATCAGFVGVSEIAYNYVVHDETRARRHTRCVVGQLLPSLLGAAAQYLPALYVPFNAADDAVSTDFAPLTR